MRISPIVCAVLIASVSWPASALAGEADVRSVETVVIAGRPIALAQFTVRAPTALERTRLALIAPPPARRRANDPLKNGVIIGAVAGTVYGVAVSALLRGELDTHGMIAGTVTCAVVGAGIGALIDRMR